MPHPQRSKIIEAIAKATNYMPEAPRCKGCEYFDERGSGQCWCKLFAEYERQVEKNGTCDFFEFVF